MFIMLLWVCGSLLSEDSASCCFCQPSASQSTFLSENWKNWTHKYKAGFIVSYFCPAPHNNILKWYKRNTFTIQKPWGFSVWKEWQHCLCSINPNSAAVCLSAAEAGTSPVEGVCFVYFCVFYACRGKKKTDRYRETEGWSSLQQVEIPFSLPLLFVSTAGLGQCWAFFFPVRVL